MEIWARLAYMRLLRYAGELVINKLMAALLIQSGQLRSCSSAGVFIMQGVSASASGTA